MNRFEKNNSLAVLCTQQVWEFANGELISINVPISMEYTFTILINGIAYGKITCSGNDLYEQAIGFLYNEGIICSCDDVKTIAIDPQKCEMHIELNTTEMTPCYEFMQKIRFLHQSYQLIEKKQPSIDFFKTDVKICATIIIEMMKEFLQYSEHHKLTGGVHSAALYTVEGLQLSFFDDIGRHNAIDKVIGSAQLHKIDLHDKVLTSTGRIWSDVILKTCCAQIPIIVSRAIPTFQAIDLAKKYGQVLIGKVRENSFYVFSRVESIITS